ncbi:hypothetical protein [Cognatiyoonia sp.]|uniref:hypothetical protein n=1 Tax=Cognatiyoonia sp. TaxID=2211652 RepID=UPI003F6A37AA
MFHITAISSTLSAHAAVAGPDLQIILDRQDSSIEVYAHLAAADIDTVFGVSAAGLAGSDGRVSYGAFRESGTYDFGKTMLNDVTLFSADGSGDLDAMSVMVHPTDLQVPYQTPFDAVLAMSICNVDDPIEPPSIDDLKIYAGFVAYPIDGHARATLALPNKSSLKVKIITFINSVYVSTQILTLDPGQPIDLPTIPKNHWLSWLTSNSLWAE